MNRPPNFRLKILHIVSGDLWAGAENMAYNLLRHLKDIGDLEISVVLLNKGRLAEQLRVGGIAVHVINENSHSFWQIFQRIRKIVKNDRPDIIHSHRYKENLLALLVALCCRGINLVSTQHGLPETGQISPSISREIKTRINFQLLSRFFTTVAVSEDMRRVLVNGYGFHQNKVEVIHNGIELLSPTAHQDNTEPFVIGSSGRLFPVKDFPLMVEIARAVSAAGAKDVRFELAGDGPELTSLEMLIRDYGLGECFRLRGHQNDMESFYKGLDIYLNTSIHEGIPMTILEALVHGLPVIAPDVGGIPEIIDNGIEGFLIGSRSPVDFAEKCLYLRDNRDEFKKMALAARQKAVLNFSADRMAENYSGLYRRLASPARRK
jgi:glycosyltransferase involved in cell wall biosynthesis